MREVFMELWKGLPMWMKISLGIAILALIAITSSCGIVKYQEDNPLEEAVEDAIKEQTGMDVDLSPRSPENRGKPKKSR